MNTEQNIGIKTTNYTEQTDQQLNDQMEQNKSDGTKYWCQNDQLHRTDGPAVEESNGSKEYWINGKQLSKFEIWTLFKVRPNCLAQYTYYM